MPANIVSISLSDSEVAQVNKLATDSNRSRSQIFKDALHLYSFESQWQEIRKAGDRIAKQLGIESDDDVERIFG
ncbi:MAG: ribbon-helix-helix domain-containing protein [bacterium]